VTTTRFLAARKLRRFHSISAVRHDKATNQMPLTETDSAGIERSIFALSSLTACRVLRVIIQPDDVNLSETKINRRCI